MNQLRNLAIPQKLKMKTVHNRPLNPQMSLSIGNGVGRAPEERPRVLKHDLEAWSRLLRILIARDNTANEMGCGGLLCRGRLILDNFFVQNVAILALKVGVESKLDLDWIGNVIYVEPCTGRPNLPKQLPPPPCFPQLRRGSERLDTRQHTNLLFSIRLCEPELSTSGGYLSSFEGS
jgi:hypothetical protein